MQTTNTIKQQLELCRLGVGQFIDISKYANHIKSKQRFETPDQTIQRSLDMHLQHYKHVDQKFLTNLQVAFEHVFAGRVLTSMRCAQFAGLPIMRQNNRMFNCCYTPCDRLAVFSEIFYNLLCGCGVGYSVQFEHVAKLPRISKFGTGSKTQHVVADTIEGWADAAHALIENSVRGVSVRFDYSLIRPKGAELVVAGGKAPGPEPLRKALVNIEQVLLGAQGRKLTPIEVFDINCFLAEAVESGGIRRAATICLFSPHDNNMMTAKLPQNFEWSGKNYQRAQANISAAMTRHAENKSVFERILDLSSEFYGEPGFFFRDRLEYGCNPCVEATFNSTCKVTGESGFGWCNLEEVVAPACKDETEFVHSCMAAAVIGTAQAGYTNFKHVGQASKRIARSEALLGLSITGMHDLPEIAFDGDVLMRATEGVYWHNKINANMIGLPVAARATCIKPSGTASLKAGCVGSGIHPHHARRYFRRMTVSPLEPAVQKFAETNPHMVEGLIEGTASNSDNTWRLIFPIEAPEAARTTVKEQSAEQFIGDALNVYKNWVEPGTFRPDSSPGLTHSVSATCTIRPDERESAKKLLWRNRHNIAAMSFVPHGFDKLGQGAPREEVTNEADTERFNYLAENYKPVDWANWQTDGNGAANKGMEPACAGGFCEA